MAKGSRRDLDPTRVIVEATSASDSRRTKYRCEQIQALSLSFHRNRPVCLPLLISFEAAVERLQLTDVHGVEVSGSGSCSRIDTRPDSARQIHRPHLINELAIVPSAEKEQRRRVGRLQGRYRD